MPRTFYITTPIYYVNDAPHIGHAYTTVLADVLARYHKMLGDEVFFLTGTDEHGQKVQQAADKRGVSPKDHCDLYSKRFLEAWKDLGIGYDYFLRTTDTDHVAYVRTQTQRLWDKGEVYAKEYEGWYSTSEERFFSEKELVDGKDPISGRAVEWIKEKNFFFKMSAYQERLIRTIEENPSFIMPDFRRNEVMGFLRQPLNDLCISRPKSRLAWGISLPFDEDYVAYVWVDALLNYASAVERRTFSDGTSMWPADIHLIGKDILTTHAVYWPTLLMALDLPLPRHILAHGWWMIDNARMSKTSGNAVSPLEMKDKYGVDAFRFFLIHNMTVGQDASFNEEVFVASINANLANDVGNSLSRVLKLAEDLHSKLTGVSPENEQDKVLRGWAESVAKSENIQEYVERFDLNSVVEKTLLLFREINRYLETSAPWKLNKEGNHERLNAVLWHASEALRIGFTLLHPVMPGKMNTALEALGITLEQSPLKWRGQANISLKTISPLFPRILVEKPSVTDDPFSAVELRAVKILTAADHPNAEALYVLTVDLGGEIRTVCAGLRKHLSKESLLGKMGVLVANLKPALLRGVESRGMLLAGEGEGGILSLASPQDARPGDRATVAGVPGSPKPQITLKEFERSPLSSQGGKVCYNAKPLQIGHGPISVSAPDGAVVR